MWQMKRDHKPMPYSVMLLLHTNVSLYNGSWWFNSLSCCSLTRLCPTFCDPKDCSTPGSPVLHDLPEFVQTHVHWIGYSISPSHPLLPPSPFAFNLSRHQGLFQWIGSLYQVAKVLELQLQHQSFQWIFRVDFLYDWLVCSPRDSQEYSLVPQFKIINSLVLSLLYGPTVMYMTTGKTIALTRCTFVGKVMSLFCNMLSRFVIAFLPGCTHI